MKIQSRKPMTYRAASCASIAALMAASVVLAAGCDKNESKTSSESKKVVDTPEGKKVVTEKSETKTTTEGK